MSTLGALLDQYAVEAALLAVLVAYVSNYVLGSARNRLLAAEWLQWALPVLQRNFAHIGDESGALLRDGDADYVTVASGRRCCSSLSARIQLQHRQDLFGGVVAGLVVPQQDRVTMTATLPAGPSGSFVLAIVHRDAHGVLNERYDLKTFARQLSHPAMPAAFSVYSEHGEVTKLVLDSDARIAQLLSHALVGQSLDYVIISDQARPPALPDSTVPTGVLPPRKTLTLAYRLPHNAQARQAVVPVYTAFVCWLMDAVDGMHVRGDVAAKLRTRRAQVLEAAQREQSKQQEHERREAAEKRLKEARRADPDKYKKRDEKKEKKRTANRVKMMRS